MEPEILRTLATDLPVPWWLGWAALGVLAVVVMFTEPREDDEH